MTKQFWVILAVIIVILGGVFVYTNRNKPDDGASGTPTSHIEGSASSGVKLVEYGDYQCPACGEFYSAVKQTTTKYADKIQFQFRNLPLTSRHPNAFAGARAAEAAGLQGKYFEMHDLLYEQNVDYYNSNESLATWINSSSPLNYFSQYAQQLGLNVDKFKKDYASSKVNSAINADMAAFNKTGDPMSTPTFYLDGKKLDNSKLVGADNQPSVDKFSALIDAEIAAKAKDKTPTTTTTPTPATKQ